MTRWGDPEAKPQTLPFNKTLLNKLKAYAVETNQSFYDVIKQPYQRFESDLLDLSTQIDEIRMQAILEKQQKRLVETIPEPTIEEIIETVEQVQ